MANANLTKAKDAKNDEFYTQYRDIDREMEAYLSFDPDTFRDKSVLLPCDDPEWSNFTRYFAANFHRLGLRRLVSTSYAAESKKYKNGYQPSLFETDSPKYDPDKTRVRGKIFTLDRDANGDGRIDIDDLEWTYLDGDGDFRSEEVRRLRDEADCIITNPPFSLFREFVAWIMEVGKKFAVIGNMNAITYKEVFPLIKENRIWLGATNFNQGMYFRVPDDFVYAPTYKFAREDNGVKVNRVPGVCWFTNIEHGRRHSPLKLMTMEDNLRYTKHKDVKERGEYLRYDNYDAIDVPYTDVIPSDYQGAMGVPVSFLGKYCPEQFEILGAPESGGRGASNGLWKEGSQVFQPFVDGKKTYVRIFIRPVAR